MVGETSITNLCPRIITLGEEFKGILGIRVYLMGLYLFMDFYAGDRYLPAHSRSISSWYHPISLPPYHHFPYIN